MGTHLELEVGPVAHGGHCVARHEGRVVFVRHALPGELVLAVVTDGGASSRFLRADAIEVRRASPDRVEPPCPFAGPGRCGGCDWQHASLAAQRRLKADVVREALRRQAGLDVPVVVEAVPGDLDGLGWRTRVHFAVDAHGRAGLRGHRSHEVVPVDDCRIASAGVRAPDALAATWPRARGLDVVSSATGQRAVVVHEASGRTRRAEGPGTVTELVGGRPFRVGADGFWQVHPGAARTLTEAVLDGLGPRPGESALDLYCGVGLFARALGDAVGPGGSVTAVESDARAVSHARRNLHDAPHVRLVGDRVEKALSTGPVPLRADLVVLDPPRSGAGARVVAAVADRAPRRVGYVACDPVALARDLATFAGLGYGLRSLRAYDLFPMTAHVEVVAILGPADPVTSSGADRQPGILTSR